MSPADFLFFRVQHMLTEPVTGELQRGTTTALTFFVRPLDRLLGHFLIPLRLDLVFNTEPGDGLLYNLQVKLLLENVERQPETETI